MSNRGIAHGRDVISLGRKERKKPSKGFKFKAKAINQLTPQKPFRRKTKKQ